MSGNIFSQSTDDMRSSLQRIAEMVAEFANRIPSADFGFCALRLPLATCTVYDSVPGLDNSEIAGLCVFNDTISRTAIENSTTLIDLRTICNESSDYSTVSPIEPSASGGGEDCTRMHRSGL